MNKTYFLREMKNEDADAVAMIEQECFSLPWSKEALLASMSQSYSYFVVAKTDDDIAGYGAIYVVAGEGEIINIAVKGEYRRCGIGEAIVKDLLHEGKVRQAEKVFLEVRESNDAAIALYERCGFEKQGIRKNFYEKPIENAVIMWKEA